MALGTDRYVATTGTDSTNDCSSSITPCKTVGYAISQSSAGDTIHIAAGTYTENLTIAIDLSLEGAGMNATILDGGGVGRVVTISSGDVGIGDLTIQNGNTGSEGGGVSNSGTLGLEAVKITGNTAYSGGGIAALGPTSVSWSVISGNHTAGGGGAGIYSSGAHTLAVYFSTLSGNTSATGTGGVHLQSGGTLNLTNATISGNTGDHTGGLMATVGTTATIINSTIASNTGSSAAVEGYGTLSFTNTIVAGNTSQNCYIGGGATWTSGGNNLDGGTTCGFGSGGDLSSTDPMLGPLANNGGSTPTRMLLAGSPAISAGNDTVCTTGPVSSLDQRGVTRPQGPHCDIGAVEADLSATFRSMGTHDGWILESSETSTRGGTSNATDTQFNLGDDAANKQYRVILCFDTSSLPDTAVVTSATVKIKKTGGAGANPFLSLGSIVLDIKNGAFSGNPALQLTDFYAAGSRNYAGSITNSPVGMWYSGAVNPVYATYVNRTGNTQWRLRFATDDNNNLLANYLRFASGNAVTSSRPQLIVTYYMP